MPLRCAKNIFCCHSLNSFLVSEEVILRQHILHYQQYAAACLEGLSGVQTSLYVHLPDIHCMSGTYETTMDLGT